MQRRHRQACRRNPVGNANHISARRVCLPADRLCIAGQWCVAAMARHTRSRGDRARSARCRRHFPLPARSAASAVGQHHCHQPGHAVDPHRAGGVDPARNGWLAAMGRRDGRLHRRVVRGAAGGGWFQLVRADCLIGHNPAIGPRLAYAAYPSRYPFDADHHDYGCDRYSGGGRVRSGGGLAPGVGPGSAAFVGSGGAAEQRLLADHRGHAPRRRRQSVLLVGSGLYILHRERLRSREMLATEGEMQV